MAELNIQRKRTNVWGWIVGIIVIALIIWFLVGVFGRRPTTATTAPAGRGASLPAHITHRAAPALADARAATSLAPALRVA